MYAGKLLVRFDEGAGVPHGASRSTLASPADGTETRGFCADGWAEWRNGKKTSASSPIYGE